MYRNNHFTFCIVIYYIFIIIPIKMHEEEEENAAELHFGPEFHDRDVQFLTNDEVFWVLSKKAAQSGSSSTEYVLLNNNMNSESYILMEIILY